MNTSRGPTFTMFMPKRNANDQEESKTISALNLELAKRLGTANCSALSMLRSQDYSAKATGVYTVAPITAQFADYLVSKSPEALT